MTDSSEFKISAERPSPPSPDNTGLHIQPGDSRPTTERPTQPSPYTSPQPIPDKHHRLIVTLLQPDSEFLTRSVVRQLAHSIRENLSATEQQVAIDLWLESPGGDPHAAYKLLLTMRELASHTRVIIPDSCKSAAVLLALGGDELVAPNSAELGPLDAIVPTGTGEPVSALEIVAAYEAAVGNARRQGLDAVGDIAETTQANEIEIVDKALAFGVNVNQALLFEFDPIVVQRARVLLEAARLYGRRGLDRKIEKGQVVGGQSQMLDKLLARLTDRYHSPHQIITPTECHQLGLPIATPSQYKHFPAARQLAERVQRSGEPLYWVFPEKDIDRYLARD